MIYITLLFACHPPEFQIVSDMSKTFKCEDGMAIGFRKDGSLLSLFDPYNKVLYPFIEFLKIYMNTCGI